jgi:hypothetical protein
VTPIASLSVSTPSRCLIRSSIFSAELHDALLWLGRDWPGKGSGRCSVRRRPDASETIGAAAAAVTGKNSRRNVPSGTDRRKCRLGIILMRAGYRACRGTERFAAGWTHALSSAYSIDGQLAPISRAAHKRAMQQKHRDGTQRVFPLTSNYPETAPREAAWISREAERSIENRDHISRYQAGQRRDKASSPRSTMRAPPNRCTT